MALSCDAAAFIGGNWDESYIWAMLKDSDPEKFDHMGFAVLPQPADAKMAPNSQNIGLGYAVAVNAKLADDPAKLEAAIDLAEYVITGNIVLPGIFIGHSIEIHIKDIGLMKKPLHFRQCAHKFRIRKSSAVFGGSARFLPSGPKPILTLL